MDGSTPHRRRWLVAGALGVAAPVLVATSLAVAAIPSSTNGKITGCISSTSSPAGVLRVIDSQSGQVCASGEKTITWPSRGLRFKGAYSTTVTYLKDDVVTDTGSSYVALANSKNVPLTDTATWAVLAAQGPPGPHGVKGPRGETGPSDSYHARVPGDVAIPSDGSYGGTISLDVPDGGPYIADAKLWVSNISGSQSGAARCFLIADFAGDPLEHYADEVYVNLAPNQNLAVPLQIAVDYAKSFQVRCRVEGASTTINVLRQRVTATHVGSLVGG